MSELGFYVVVAIFVAIFVALMLWAIIGSKDHSPPPPRPPAVHDPYQSSSIGFIAFIIALAVVIAVAFAGGIIR